MSGLNDVVQSLVKSNNYKLKQTDSVSLCVIYYSLFWSVLAYSVPK